jgi:hypothetical protein
MAKTYRDSLSFGERIKKSKNILKNYEGRIPMILEKSPFDKYLPRPTKTKFIIPNEFTIAMVLTILKKNLNVNDSTAIYITTNNTILSGSLSLDSLYNKYKDADGFLYLNYCSENVFG